MSRAIVVGVLVIALVSLFAPGVTQKARAAPPGCDDHDLRGSYGLVGSGVLGAPDTSFGYVGVLDFDGQGIFSALIRSTFLGTNAAFSGTYSVLPECRGSISSSGVFSADVVVVEGGNEVLFTTIALCAAPLYLCTPTSGVMSKTARANPPGCDNHDLRGSYGLVLSGVFGFLGGSGVVATSSSFGYVGVLEFDGQGAYAGIVGNTGGPGTYSVSPDCSGVISNIGGAPSSSLVVVQGGNEVLLETGLLFLGINAPTTGVMKKIK